MLSKKQLPSDWDFSNAYRKDLPIGKISEVSQLGID